MGHRWLYTFRYGLPESTRIRIDFIVLVSLLFSCSCHYADTTAHRGKDGGALAALPDPLPLRVDVVGLADDIAAQAQRAKGTERDELLLAAAKLRERLWRLERRAADALEAIDLYRQLGDSGTCIGALNSEVLSAELDRKPQAALEVMTKIHQHANSTHCDAAARRVLVMLDAFRGKAPPEGAGATEAAADDVSEALLQPHSKVAADARPVTIQKIEKYVSADAARIVIVMSHPTTFRVGALSENADANLPPRLYVDVDHSRIADVSATNHSGLVRSIRVAAHQNSSRIAIDLRYPAFRRVFYEPEPFRLVLDLARQSPALATPNQGSRRVGRVVIDPGHGGNDPGAIGPHGLKEKDVTLDIAHRAAPIIARELGISTLLTRDVDEYVPLDERTARANAFGADLFVSVHCNAAENTGSDGVLTFVLDDSSDSAAARIAARENAASAAAGQELASAFRRIQDSTALDRSVQFAQLLQRATVASLQSNYGHITDQGVRRAGFYVLAGALMPAVLYEVSFISNPDAEIRLNTGDYRQKLADAIVNSIRAYREGL